MKIRPFIPLKKVFLDWGTKLGTEVVSGHSGFWGMNDILCPYLQLYRASALFETIRHEAQLSTDYKLSLFDLQTSSYQALQRVLVSLGESGRGSHFLGVSLPVCVIPGLLGQNLTYDVRPVTEHVSV